MKLLRCRVDTPLDSWAMVLYPTVSVALPKAGGLCWKLGRLRPNSEQVDDNGSGSWLRITTLTLNFSSSGMFMPSMMVGRGSCLQWPTAQECFLGGSEAIDAEGLDSDELKRNSSEIGQWSLKHRRSEDNLRFHPVPLYWMVLCSGLLLKKFREIILVGHHWMHKLQGGVYLPSSQKVSSRHLIIRHRFASWGVVNKELTPLVGQGNILDVGITKWASNPYIRGAWSYAQVNSSVKEHLMKIQTNLGQRTEIDSIRMYSVIVCWGG